MARPLFRIHEGGKLANYAVKLPEVLSVEKTAERLEDASHILGGLACGFYVNEEQGTTTLRFVNYPRAKYGDRSPNKIRRTAIDVAQLFRGTILMPDYLKGRLPENRVVMGLRSGYDGDDITDAGKIEESLDPGNSASVKASRMEVISVSPGSIYTEPALELSFSARPTLTKICKAAVEFGQERFSLEVPKYERVFMIETPHCKDPDQTSFVEKTLTAVSGFAIAPSPFKA